MGPRDRVLFIKVSGSLHSITKNMRSTCGDHCGPIVDQQPPQVQAMWGVSTTWLPYGTLCILL